MLGMAVILLLFFGISLMGFINALQCPECKKLFALQWQEVHKRDKCKYCSHVVYAKDFVPPKASYLKFMSKCSPITRSINDESED